MSVYYVGGIPYSSDELYHHGIKGQKWGVRRKEREKFSKQNRSQNASSDRSSRVKRGVKIGAAIVGAGLLAYGAYKAHSVFSDTYRSNITNIGKRAIETLEGQRKNALSQGRRRDRKKINLDYDRRREAILNVVADNKSTKAMYRNLGNGVKDIIKSRLRR